MGADWATAVATLLTFFATAAAVIVAARQLSEIARQTGAQLALLKEQTEATAKQRERERQWQTIAVCRGYCTEPVLEAAKRRLRQARSDQAPWFKDPMAVQQDVKFILNYLDTIAIGVLQGVYVKEIVRDHLGSVFCDLVDHLLLGGWGDFQIEKNNFANLIKMTDEFRVIPPIYKAAP